MAGGGDVAQLAGLNRLAHILRLDETSEFPDNHHLAGTKPIVINPLRHPTRLWQVGALAMVQLIETLVMPSGDTSNMIVALRVPRAVLGDRGPVLLGGLLPDATARFRRAAMHGVHAEHAGV